MKSKKVALIGMMGAGKSTVAKKLAQKTGLICYETDEIFETLNKTTIKEFFSLYGEEKFRNAETKIIQDIIKKDSFILSLGGGAILSEFNRKLLICDDILSIYLYASADAIYQRLKNDKARPLLQVEDPRKEIENILSKRENLYSLAKLRIETDNKAIYKIVEEIMNYEKN